MKHCMEQGKSWDSRILQFNAVVKSNASALHLYEKLWIYTVGRDTRRIPFMKDGVMRTSSPIIMSCDVQCPYIVSCYHFKKCSCFSF